MTAAGGGGDAERESLELFGVLVEKANGERRFTDEQILAFVPTLLTACGDDEGPLSAARAVLLRRWAGLMGLTTDDDEASADQKIDAYYGDHPVPDALVEAFEAALRDQRARAENGRKA